MQMAFYRSLRACTFNEIIFELQADTINDNNHPL